MRSVKRFIFFIFFYFILGTALCFANNIKVQNVSLETRRATTQPVVLVEFDVSWDNSWRNTENYDAAWLVFKASVESATEFTPCTVYNNTSGYNLGNSVGSDPDMEFVFPADGAGVFFQRKATGAGTVTSQNVRLSMICDDTTVNKSIAIKAIGIEMVYIPEGAFHLGDTESFAGFEGGNNNQPWFIEDEATISTSSNPVSRRYYFSAGNSGEYATGTAFSIGQYFPKGFAAFYAMKYPVTEGQWVEFVNSIPVAAQTNRDITAVPGKAADSVIKRNTVTYSGKAQSGTTSREDRAVSYISWMDLAAYLDWIALRPMTELEYEKMARGPVANVAGEYAWGTTNIIAGMTFTGSPEDGNEGFISANIANAIYDSTTYSQGDTFLGTDYQQGPARVGVFASNASTRERAGAGYYGVMHLSDNLFERVVTVGNTTGITFYPVNGDGSLNTHTGYEGNAYQLGWPGTEQTGQHGVKGATGAGFRGGSWASVWALLRVSDRSNAALTSTSRDNRYGGRGVRSVAAAPSLPECADGVATPPEQCDDGGVCAVGTPNACTTLDLSLCSDDAGQYCAPVAGDGCNTNCECENDACSAGGGDG